MLDSELNVKEIACVEFPMMIETGWDTFDNREELLNKYLAEIPKNVDTLVLGCTHYPLIRKDIEKNIKIKGKINFFILTSVQHLVKQLKIY